MRRWRNSARSATSHPARPGTGLLAASSRGNSRHGRRASGASLRRLRRLVGTVGAVAVSYGHEHHHVQASPIRGALTSTADLALQPQIPAVQVPKANGTVLCPYGGGEIRLVAEIPSGSSYFVLLGAHYCKAAC